MDGFARLAAVENSICRKTVLLFLVKSRMKKSNLQPLFLF